MNNQAEKKVEVRSPLGVEWMFFPVDTTDEDIKARIEQIHDLGIVTYSGNGIYEVVSKKKAETPDEKRHVNVKVKGMVLTMVFPLGFDNEKISEILSSAFDKQYAYDPKKFLFHEKWED